MFLNERNTEFDIIATAKMLGELDDCPFSEPTINYFIRNRKNNGLSESGAVLQIGRSMFLHKKKFLEWCLSKKG